MLDRGVPADFTDDNGSTALHKASANGHVGCVERLLDAGAISAGEYEQKKGELLAKM